MTVGAHGAHHVIALFRHADQTRDLLRRVLQIGVQRNHQIAGHLVETGHDRRVLAIVAVQQNGDDVAVRLFRRRGQHVRGVVAAAIVDEDDFIRLR